MSIQRAMGILGKLFEWNDRVAWEVESTFNKFLSCRYAIASHHESGSDRSEAWLLFYFNWITFFHFGVSELMPPYLNLAAVRFIVNGYLDSQPVFGRVCAVYGKKQS